MSAAQPKRLGLPLPYLTLVALSLSPALAVSFTQLCIALLASAMNYQPFADFGATIINGALYGGALGAAPALLIGLPAHTSLLRSGTTEPGPYAGIFALIGLGVLLVMSTFTGMGTMFASLPIAIVLFGIVFAFAGAVSGLIFWLIRRPDKDQPKLVATPPAN